MNGDTHRPIRIALVAGETSGDLLAADLARRLRDRYPDAEMAGVCGPAMRDAGVESWYDCAELAVMGLAEVLRHLPRLLRLRAALRKRLLAWQPDVLIGIDAPDFNLGLERYAKRAGIKTVHYVSPSVWAWRQGRAARIGASADRVLCLFPMEPAIYAAHGVDARFVGHPLADHFPLLPDRAAARGLFGIDEDAVVIAVLPGSRLGEIRRIGPAFIGAVDLLKMQQAALRFIAPMATAACRNAYTELGGDKHCQLVNGLARECMIAADVVLLASGTAALEGLFAKRPLVVAYKVSALTHWLVRTFGLLKTKLLSLPNALAGDMLVPEVLQDDCTPQRLAAEVRQWLDNPAAVAALQPRFLAIHESLRRGASTRAAEVIAELIDQ
ncbi:MAG: lipid-A-disaccharide synthase [Pseudomarimonas sp.]